MKLVKANMTLNALSALSLTLLASIASATSLVCDSKEYGPDHSYVVTISSKQESADVFHPEVGERIEMTCKFTGTKASNDLVVYCDDESVGDDTITSLELTAHPVSKRLMGNLVSYAPFNHQRLTLATVTCVEK